MGTRRSQDKYHPKTSASFLILSFLSKFIKRMMINSASSFPTTTESLQDRLQPVCRRPAVWVLLMDELHLSRGGSQEIRNHRAESSVFLRPNISLVNSGKQSSNQLLVAFFLGSLDGEKMTNQDQTPFSSFH